MKKYTLHFRNSGIPFVVMEIVYKDKSSYGAFDYVLFYKNGLLEGYLSDKGLSDARKFGLKLMKNHKTVYDKMLKFRDKTKKFSYTNWDEMKLFIKEFGGAYVYCEQPILSGIEDIFEKNCENPAVCLKDPSKGKFKTEKGRIAHDILIKFGKMKYDLHLALEKPLLALLEKLGNDPSVFDYTEKEIDMILNKHMKVIPSKKDVVIADRKIFFNYVEWEKKVKTHDDIIKGKAVSLGKARGMVKIFFDAFTYENIPKGTVVVSGMTNPQMTPYLKNAAAIVTDEGGLTCHAAIIARELHIPCIVGTAHATQILKDGDYVEVDADNGIVKKLGKI
jgi:phosphohistidine swiveling domain-containing protein